jgi:signal transduction histidine kinase
MSAEPDSALSFPDGAKLELDQLIDQLVERAQGVQQAQGRLRALLRAIEVVTGDLALEAVLRHVVEAALALAGARYGALGVIAHDGGLEQFIHVGIDDALVERIGHLPEGKGLLGALITDPRPIRLEHITDDSRSSGFPNGHPPMDSFLGVPIRVRGEVFGNLYLTESERGRFTAEDEELVRSLAVTAGTAISNARLYQESRLQQQWLAASAEISAQMLIESGEDPLQMIGRHAHGIAGAELVTVGLLTSDRSDLVIEVAVGEGAADLLGGRFVVAETIEGVAVEQQEPVLLRSAGEAGGRRSHLADLMDTGPVMVLPLVGSGDVFGTLTIARAAGRASFTSVDLAMAAAFANHASLAHELALARADQQRVSLLEDRDRIARDLHDHVIQQLFAIGLSLEGLAATAGPSHVAEKLHERVDDIDRTIRQIRTSIFELRGPLGSATASGTRQRLLEIANELAPALGFSPRIAFSGNLDSALSGELADDAIACVREAVTNVAKHAKARAVEVDVSVVVGELTITVLDDGVGVGDVGRSSGLANLRARAERYGGSFDVSERSSGGTQLLWRAPVG